MPSKPLAFGLLVVACMAAAGGGAYFATLHHNSTPQPVAVSSTPATISQSVQPAPAEPGPAVAVAPADGSSSDAAPAASPVTRRSDEAKAGGSQRVKSGGTRAKTPVGQPNIPAPPVKVVEPASPSPAATATTQPAVSQGVDPNPQTQRPWPGQPATQASSPAAAEPVKAEPEPASREDAKQWEEVVVPTESVLGLQLESSVNSETARVEDRVEARVTRDVKVGGRAAIPSGTRVLGVVTLVEKGGRVKERARLGIRFNTLVFADSTRVSIGTDTVYREGESPANQSSAKIGGAAIGGAIIGAILGGGKGAAIGSGIGAAGGTAVAMSGDRLPVVLHAGTLLSVRTQSPISLTVEK